MATTSNPATALFGSCGSSFIAKAQCGALRGYTVTYIPGLSVGWRNAYGKGSELHTRIRKVRLTCRMACQQSKSIRPYSPSTSCSFRYLVDESNNGNDIRTISIFGSTTLHTSFSAPSVRLSSKNVRPTCEAFVKRMFSANAMNAASTSESMFINDGKSSHNLLQCNFSNKPRKQTKTLSIRSGLPNQSAKKGVPDLRVFAHKNVNAVNCIETLAEDGQKEMNSTKSAKTKSTKLASSAVDNAESKPKQKSRSKKKKDELSGAVSSSDDLPAKGSRTVNGRGQSLQIAESNSSVNATKELADLSDSTEVVTKKKASGSRKKRESLTEVDVKENTNGALPKVKEDVKGATSSSKSSPKPNPQTINGIKSINLKPLYPPMGKSIVVVESLTKAKVIQGYLGKMYEVIPSYGHVRDLAGRSGSVRPDDDFSMVWEVPSSAWTHLKSIKAAISGADNLILASDPDREGEAIAWHIIEMLQQQDALRKDTTVARVVFQEITESAIKSALQNPRDIDVNLVQAYLARRALDYLIGFNISPLLWRKLPGCQSAGRVQSAALALICDRQMEIEEFNPQEYWTVEATFNTSNVLALSDSYSFRSYLTHFNSKKLNQLSIGSEAEAKNIEKLVTVSDFKVIGVKRTKVNRNPPTPYITSTLQQDAANKLDFSASYTMKLAQKLYEGVQLSDGEAAGLITYMRTDGLNISDGALKEICSFVTERCGPSFAARSPRKFFKKVKNAQEAHEAIRPTDIRRLPSTLAKVLDEDCLKLYTLIWARTMACQMEPAKISQIQLDIGNDCGSISFRAACSALEFPGYRSVSEDMETWAIRDTENEAVDRDELYKILSNLKQGDSLSLGNVELNEHHTQPPPRYSEASLVKKLEELGIGRPSTYASTLKVLQDRKYVTAKNRVLFPEFRGLMVSAFLSRYFTEVTDYSFTADMETELDNVSAGSTEWKGLLRDYWSRFSTYCDHAAKVHSYHVERMLEKTYANFLFSSLPDESRTCPSCLEGTLIFRVSRFGAGYFIGCDQHPRCKFIAKTLHGEEEEDEPPEKKRNVEEPKLLGTHPVSGEKVLQKNGPFGYYVQLGDDRKGYSPKRASIPVIMNANSITLEEAIDLLRFPITIGDHPVDSQPVLVQISKGGFAVKHRRNTVSVPKNINPLAVDMKKALKLLSSKGVRQAGRPKGSKRREEEAIDDF